VKSAFYPVILAGGRGTRFWPLSRKKRAKQMLALNSERSMIQETADRLRAVSPEKRFWVITNGDLRDGIVKQLPKLPKRQIVAEPAGRNTAPAIGLAAWLIARDDPNAVLGLFPSDHVIEDEERFTAALKKAIEIAAAGPSMVVMGIRPTRPETGYGYIEVSEPPPTAVVAAAESAPAASTAKATRKTKSAARSAATKTAPTPDLTADVLKVRRFREKPDRDTAEEFLRGGNFFWNSGMFVWSAQTVMDAMIEHLPNTATILQRIADTWGTQRFDSTLRKLYSQCDNISVDYALLEPRSAKGDESNLYCIPAEFRWNDLGSWTALYEHHARELGQSKNVVRADKAFELDASGNYIYSPKKFVAAVGVTGLVVVETGDALLITTRDRAQDVGKIVKYLDEQELKKLV
jgi:mannose-1-phosphate guanylyltransferase